ncbi:hypothetical protein WICMUC_000430 [Wickerhamomyces mucosus]|uniref:Uncharacterized protein n=1 Tax=Wickerhamomyces mucosus TaxID=1378264 RepID=A0A9P8PZT7_9ASCO|nr:hypothetical protein WICMUC_000430 [Wickerhamomyces mucosus]
MLENTSLLVIKFKNSSDLQEMVKSTIFSAEIGIPGNVEAIKNICESVFNKLKFFNRNALFSNELLNTFIISPQNGIEISLIIDEFKVKDGDTITKDLMVFFFLLEIQMLPGNNELKMKFLENIKDLFRNHFHNVVIINGEITEDRVPLLFYLIICWNSFQFFNYRCSAERSKYKSRNPLIEFDKPNCERIIIDNGLFRYLKKNSDLKMKNIASRYNISHRDTEILRLFKELKQQQLSNLKAVEEPANVYLKAKKLEAERSNAKIGWGLSITNIATYCILTIAIILIMRYFGVHL